MKSYELSSEVSTLTRKIQELLQKPIERDENKLRSLTESIMDQFGAMKDDAKSQSFSFLLGLLWGLHQNVTELSALLKPETRYDGMN